MNKHLELLENFENLNRDELVALLSQVLTTAEDVAYGYDITDEMTERLQEDLNEFGIKCKIVDEDI